jgi:hypothetical protein
LFGTERAARRRLPVAVDATFAATRAVVRVVDDAVDHRGEMFRYADDETAGRKFAWAQMHLAARADLHRRSPNPSELFHHAVNCGLVDTGARIADAAFARAGAFVRRGTIHHVVDVLVGKTGRDRDGTNDAVTSLAAISGGRATTVVITEIFRSRHAGNGDARSGAGAGCGFVLFGGLVRFGRALGFAALFRRDAQSFDLETLVHVKALLTIKALDEFARGFADRAGDAGGVDFDGAAFGAGLSVFVAECDVVCVHS